MRARSYKRQIGNLKVTNPIPHIYFFHELRFFNVYNGTKYAEVKIEQTVNNESASTQQIMQTS